MVGVGVALQIPAGALDRDVVLSAAALDDAATQALPALSAPGLSGDAELASRVYALTPHGTAFAQPVPRSSSRTLATATPS